MAMTASELDQLTAQERAGRLTDEALVLVHARYPAPHRRDTDERDHAALRVVRVIV